MHRLAALAEAVDVDDRDQVVQALLAGVLDRLPDRALGHLGVAAQRPHAVGQPVQLTRSTARCRRRSACPGPASRWRRRPRAGSGVGWPSQPRAELAEGEQLLVGDRAGGDEHRVDERRRVALGEDQVVVVGVLRARRSRSAGGAPSAPPSGRPPTSTRWGAPSWRRRPPGSSRFAGAGRAGEFLRWSSGLPLGSGPLFTGSDARRASSQTYLPAPARDRLSARQAPSAEGAMRRDTAEPASGCRRSAAAVATSTTAAIRMKATV